MTFLRNCWYAAAFGPELGAKPLARRILGEKVCLFRTESGVAKAVADRCSHRFAPMWRGRVVGENLQCGYHGLEFDGTGRCVHNPHGQGVIPPEAHIAGWPVAERYGAVWIWMGDPAKADPALLPDLPRLEQPERYEYVPIYMHTPGNYQLIADNLLDLSHVNYLHPYLVDFDQTGTQDHEVTAEGNSVTSTYYHYGTALSGIYAMTWPDAVPEIDMRSEMVWTAPSLLQGDMRARPAGAEEWADSSRLLNIHFVTPETESTTHYFWIGGFNIAKSTPEFVEQYREISRAVFVDEDLAMIGDVEDNMQTDDLLSLRPAILTVDTAALRARRIVARVIAAEQADDPVSEKADPAAATVFQF